MITFKNNTEDYHVKITITIMNKNYINGKKIKIMLLIRNSNIITIFKKCLLHILIDYIFIFTLFYIFLNIFF